MNDDLDDYPDSQGGRANFNGRKFEELIAAALRALGYACVPAKNLDDLISRKNGLFTEVGIFARKCHIPFDAPCHRRKNRSAEVDCAIHTNANETIILSCKSQAVNGSAEEKLEFEIRNLWATGWPAAMCVLGPLRGRDGKEGWSPDVLEPIWERTMDGNDRIMLFRSIPRLLTWVEAGLPIASGRRTFLSLFTEFCDREP